jgi:hypothetical protein
MPNVGVFQRPGPAKIRPSKFAPSVSEQPRPAQTAAPAAEPTAGQLAHAKAIFGNPKPNGNGFDRAVRDAVKPSLVLCHDCQQKLDGHGERCSCKSKIPRADAERKVADGTHKWLTTTKADGTLYVSSQSIVSLTPKKEPSKDVVRIHACFDITKEHLPDRCYCDLHVTREEAEIMIAAGIATWLLVTREGTTYPLHNALVLTATEVAKREAAIRKMKRPKGPSVAKFLMTLQAAVSKGIIKKADADLSESEIWAGFKNPEEFCLDHPRLFPNGLEQSSYLSSFKDKRTNVYRQQSYFVEDLLYCTRWYWDRLLTGADLKTPVGDLNDEAPMFMRDAPEGMGLIVTGGYDSSQLARVKAAHDRDLHGRRVKPKGNGPDSDDRRGDTTPTTQLNSREPAGTNEGFPGAGDMRLLPMAVRNPDALFDTSEKDGED